MMWPHFGTCIVISDECKLSRHTGQLLFDTFSTHCQYNKNVLRTDGHPRGSMKGFVHNAMHSNYDESSIMLIADYVIANCSAAN